jgi:biotin transport system substrate-specific component
MAKRVALLSGGALDLTGHSCFLNRLFVAYFHFKMTIIFVQRAVIKSLQERVTLPLSVIRVGVPLLLALVGSMLLALSAKYKVPMVPVPMSLQSLVVLMIGVAYGWRLGAATILVYIAEGMAGIPVFANTPPQVPSPAYLLGGTGGYLAGFVLAAALMGWASEKGFARRWHTLLPFSLAGTAVILALGWVWLAFFAGMGLSETWGKGALYAFNEGVLKFIWVDAPLKSVLVALIMPSAMGYVAQSISHK